MELADNGTGILKTGYEAHSNQRFILDNEHSFSGERQPTKGRPA